MSKPKVRDESFAVSRSYGHIRRQRTASGLAWLDGTVRTRWGIVEVYSEPRHSRYDFIHDGRHHIRTENRERTERGLAIQAARFAEDVVRG